MKKPLTKQEMFSQNIIAVKIDKQKREYRRTLGGIIVKQISRSVYLKICWYCGSSYESNRRSSFACCKRCSQNLTRQRKKGWNPPARMDQIMKDKNVKEIKDLRGYK